jgi:hypothetical protein
VKQREAISRISSLAASLRRCLTVVANSESVWTVRPLLEELASLERGIEQLANDIMVDEWKRALEKAQAPLFCHCGSPRKPGHETCDARSCVAVAREARKAIKRYEGRL